MLLSQSIERGMADMTINRGLSERIREMAKEKYIGPALRSGAVRVSVRVRDLMDEFRKKGFAPDKNTPQFCTAIQRPDFLQENGLEIDAIDGPRSKLSTSVVIHYRVRGGKVQLPAATENLVSETPAERAYRLTEKLRGLLKNELAEYGGAEGFMRWVRSDEDETA
jgi:hypothetical protein